MIHHVSEDLLLDPSVKGRKADILAGFSRLLTVKRWTASHGPVRECMTRSFVGGPGKCVDMHCEGE